MKIGERYVKTGCIALVYSIIVMVALAVVIAMKISIKVKVKTKNKWLFSVFWR